MTDRQTDGQTDGQTDRVQTYSPLRFHRWGTKKNPHNICIYIQPVTSPLVFPLNVRPIFRYLSVRHLLCSVLIRCVSVLPVTFSFLVRGNNAVYDTTRT